MIQPPRKGLTLLEVIVVIAILVILLSFLLPAVRRVREPASRTRCCNNLKQIVLALYSFQDSNRFADPFANAFPPGCVGPVNNPEARLSWMVELLPYIENNNLYRQFDLKTGYEANLTPAESRVEMFLCHPDGKSVTKQPFTNYVAMSGIGLDAANQLIDTPGNGFMGYDRLTSSAMIKDGTSSTIALIETHANIGPWAQGGPSTLRGFDPANWPIQGKNSPFGGHGDLMIVGMADGAVRYIKTSIDPKTLAAAITIDGGEVLGADW